VWWHIVRRHLHLVQFSAYPVQPIFVLYPMGQLQQTEQTSAELGMGLLAEQLP
jgi:hypothetical protein